MQAIYSAATGLKSQQRRLDTIAANIANANTTGYKAVRVDFKDALYTAMDSPVGGNEARNLFAGSGVMLGATTTGFSNGTLMATGSMFDFAISGSGFFTVENAGGENLYTRSGSFGITSEGGNSLLVTAQGYYVLDAQGNRITLPEDTSGLGVTDTGVLHTASGEVAALGIAEFSNPDGLKFSGDSCFEATEVSGAAVPSQNPAVVQGSVESSNVNLAQELTLLIRSQRAYSLASKALQTADDMDGLANNMR